MTPATATNLQQLLAASALIVTLERIASSGILPENEEMNVRILICRACRVFEIPSIAERPVELAAVSRC